MPLSILPLTALRYPQYHHHRILWLQGLPPVSRLGQAPSIPQLLLWPLTIQTHGSGATACLARGTLANGESGYHTSHSRRAPHPAELPHRREAPLYSPRQCTTAATAWIVIPGESALEVGEYIIVTSQVAQV